jgi:hypothetical protein
MKKKIVLAFTLSAIAAVSVTAEPFEHSAAPDPHAVPVFSVTLPAGYRDWKFISVAHEAGNNNDIRVIVGNDIAVKAAREGTLPYPDGAIIARLAYAYVPSAQNNAAFGKEQSWVAGEPTNVQVEVKDASRYRETGGWGYGQFDNGVANTNAKTIGSCFACHAKLPAAADFIFTRYSK